MKQKEIQLKESEFCKIEEDIRIKKKETTDTLKKIEERDNEIKEK